LAGVGDDLVHRLDAEFAVGEFLGRRPKESVVAGDLDPRQRDVRLVAALLLAEGQVGQRIAQVPLELFQRSAGGLR